MSITFETWGTETTYLNFKRSRKNEKRNKLKIQTTRLGRNWRIPEKKRIERNKKKTKQKERHAWQNQVHLIIQQNVNFLPGIYIC